MRMLVVFLLKHTGAIRFEIADEVLRANSGLTRFPTVPNKPMVVFLPLIILIKDNSLPLGCEKASHSETKGTYQGRNSEDLHHNSRNIQAAHIRMEYDSKGNNLGRNECGIKNDSYNHPNNSV